MSTTITLGDLVITGTGVYEGFVYDKLIDWQSLPEIDLNLERRPNAPGAFAPGRTFTGEAVLSIEGQYHGASEIDSIQAREDLAALYNDGLPVTMMVADALRTTTREVYVKAINYPWTIHREFSYTIDVVAPDPRRYGATGVVEAALAVAGSGYRWPATWPSDWGTAPTSGRVSIVNSGNTETSSLYVISGGAMPDGFVLVNVDTGERLTYVGPLAPNTFIVIDSVNRTAFENDITPRGRFLASPEWWGVPKRGTVVVQFLARGPVTGTPRVTVHTAPAFY